MDLFCQKGKFQRIDNAFMHFYPFFILHKESKGISGIKVVGSADNSVPSRLWSADSFGQGPISSLMLAKLVVPLTTNTH